MKTRLQELRKGAGYKSAKSFAEHLGMNVGTYTSYEQGTRQMPMDVACDICDALGCSLDELAGRTPRINYHTMSLEGLSEQGRKDVEDFAEFTRFKEYSKSKGQQ